MFYPFTLFPLLVKMSYIADPELEEENNEVYHQKTFGERLSALNEQYMRIDKMEDVYFLALIYDLCRLADQAERENDILYVRESLYLIYKSLVTPFGKECLVKYKDLLDKSIWRAEDSLDLIDNLGDQDFGWDNTKNAINDFLDIADNM